MIANYPKVSAARGPSPSSSSSFPKKRRKQFEIPPHQMPGEDYHATIQKLKTLYTDKVQSLEEKYLFHLFGFEELTDQQLEAKAQVRKGGKEEGREGEREREGNIVSVMPVCPVVLIFLSLSLSPSSLPLFLSLPQVLLLGQYSTGKTTMIRYLLGRDYLGLHVGPEPTTDKYALPPSLPPSLPLHLHCSPQALLFP